MFKDLEATLDLKEILARKHETTQIANTLKALTALMLNQPFLNRYEAQEDCFTFSFYLFLIFSATS